jgi:hypothetical protein
MSDVPPELARFCAGVMTPDQARAELQSPGHVGLAALADVLRERSDRESDRSIRAARERRRDDSLRAEGKSAGLLEAARLLAELAGEL